MSDRRALPLTRAPHLCGARALFTTREGGTSTGDFSALNLARHVGDDDAAVDRNRALLEAELGLPVVFCDQVHSTDVAVIAEGDDPGLVRTADAVVTRRHDVALAMMVADCLPVLLVDGTAGVVAAVHAGRRGLLDGVLQAAVATMGDLGARPENLRAEIGPGICGRCYEVPDALLAESAALLPATSSRTSWGTAALDLPAGARQVLASLGIPDASVLSSPACTREDPRLFSYRRDARTGRFAGVIALA